jgi:hypothetical protein
MAATRSFIHPRSRETPFGQSSFSLDRGCRHDQFADNIRCRRCRPCEQGDFQVEGARPLTTASNTLRESERVASIGTRSVFSLLDRGIFSFFLENWTGSEHA